MAPLDLNREDGEPSYPSYHETDQSDSPPSTSGRNGPTMASNLDNGKHKLHDEEKLQHLAEPAPLAALVPVSSHASLPPPPDGGFHAWLQVAMGWFIIFLTWGYLNSFGSFQAHYTLTLPESPSTISWIGSTQTCLTFIVGAFSGRLLDAGYFLPTFAVGSVLNLLGIFLMSVSTKYWQLMLTQGVLTGVGCGIIFTPSVALVSTYFSRRRGLAVGLCTTANSVGGVVYPIMVRELLPKVGFGWTTRTVGFLNLLFLMLAGTFMRPRLSPRKAGPLVDWSAFTETVWCLYVAAMFLVVWAVYYSFYYVASFAIDEIGFNYSDSTLIVTILNGAGFPARILVPLLADRFGTLNVMAPVSVGVAVIAFGWLGVRDRAGLYTWVILYGIFNGAFQCLMPTGMASITKRLDTIGTRLGMMFSIISIAGLTGPPLGGALHGINGLGWKPPQGWAGAVMFCGAVSLVSARFARTEFVLKGKC